MGSDVLEPASESGASAIAARHRRRQAGRRVPPELGAGPAPDLPGAAWGRILLAGGLAYLVLVSLLSWRFTIDDAFILFRYAANAAAGHGPVFNPGERVEGFSSPAWVGMLAAATALGLDPVWVSKLVGLACAVGLVLVVHRALRASGCDAGIAGAAALWVSALPTLHHYTTSGLETVAFTFAFVTAALLPALVPTGRARAILTPALLLATATLRPEGPAAALALGAVAWMRDRTPGMRAGLVVGGLLGAGLLALRFAYFGALVPNTALVKTLPIVRIVADHQVAAGLHALARAVKSTMMPAFDEAGGLVTLGLVMVAALTGAARLVPATAWVGAAAGLAAVAVMPSDWMPGVRFALPVLPLAGFLAALGADGLARGVAVPFRRPLVWAGVAVLAVALLRAFTITGPWLAAQHRGTTYPPLRAESTYLEIGRWLREHARPGDRLLTYEVGAVAYASGLYIVDSEGLVTPEVARVIRRVGEYGPVRTGADPAAMAEVVEHCMQRRPEWFLVRSRSPLPLEVGEPIAPAVGSEPIQRELLEQMGGSMVLARSFELLNGAPAQPDRYLLLRRMEP